MDFSLSAEQQMLQETARRFAQTELSAHATDIQNNNSPPNLVAIYENVTVQSPEYIFVI